MHKIDAKSRMKDTKRNSVVYLECKQQPEEYETLRTQSTFQARLAEGSKSEGRELRRKEGSCEGRKGAAKEGRKEGRKE